MHRSGLRWQGATVEQLDRLAEGAVHQGAVAQLKSFRYLELDQLWSLPQAAGRVPLLLLLDGIEDPHNLGSIIRSAQALGVDGIVFPQDRAVGITPVVAKVSAGAVESARISQVVNLSRAIEQIKSAGLWVAAVEQGGEVPLWKADLTIPLALVIGAEGRGLRPLVRRHCDLSLTIPMQGGVGSLNASVAAAIVLYEVRRQRHGKDA